MLAQRLSRRVHFHYTDTHSYVLSQISPKHTVTYLRAVYFSRCAFHPLHILATVAWREWHIIVSPPSLWGLDRLSRNCYLDALGSFHITTSQKDSHRIEPGNLQSAETVLKPQNVLCGWNLNLRQLFLEGKIHQIMRLWTRIHSEDFFQQD